MGKASGTIGPVTAGAGRVPQILLRFALPGALIGFLVFMVSETGGFGEPEDWWRAGLVTALLSGGGTYILVTAPGLTRQASLSGVVVGACLGGLMALASAGEGARVTGGVLPVLAALTIFIVVLPFLRARLEGAGLFDYRRLFAHAWTTPVVVAVAQAFVLIGWLLALLVAALFAFIGLPYLRDAIGESGFLLTYGGLLEAVAVGVLREREQAVLAARSLLMALIRVTAPVFAACAGIFVIAVMFRGFGSLIGELSPVATLATSALAGIVMINAIIAGEGRPETPLFSAVARVLGFLILFLMVLSVYGLYLRIGEEGLTPNRIIAAVAVAHLALYVPLYAVGALSEGWGLVRRGNIVLSWVLVATAVFVMTPFFTPQSWSARSQLEKMSGAPGKADLTDLAYLRDRLGPPGRAAFDGLAAGEGVLAEKARELGDRPAPYPLPSDEAVRRGTIEAVPKGTTLDPALRQKALRVTPPGRDALVLQPSAGEAFVLVVEPYGVTFHHLRFGGGAWETLMATPVARGEEERERLLEAARRGEAGFAAFTYRLPVIGGDPVHPGADALEPYRAEQSLGEAEEGAN
jgi:hypothetical protein